VEKTRFEAATSDLTQAAVARGTIFAIRSPGRGGVHQVVRALYEQMREVPSSQKSYEQALRALAEAFAEVNWDEEVGQYTNRKCEVPGDLTLRPWRAIVEIGWTGGSMLAYPFALAERIFRS
jgi:hypothetical protein